MSYLGGSISLPKQNVKRKKLTLIHKCAAGEERRGRPKTALAFASFSGLSPALFLGPVPSGKKDVGKGKQTGRG
jgi:hypothetical protein